MEAYRFHGNNIEEYGIANGPAESLTSFTVSFWVNISDDTLVGSVLSYAYECARENNCDNGLYIQLKPKLTFHAMLKPNYRDIKVARY